MGQIIQEQGAVRLVVYDRLTEAFEERIAQAILGREGRLRYQHTHGLTKAAQLRDTFFLQLEWKSRVLGVIALSRQSVRINHVAQKVLYVRYFSVSGLLSSRQGQAQDRHRDKGSLIKSWIQSLFDDPGDIPGIGMDIAGLYAYVEADNLPSLQHVRMTGFEQVGQFVTTIYSRALPRRRVQMRTIPPGQYPLIISLLDRYYHSVQLAPDWAGLLAHPSRRYVAHYVEGEIVAGICYAVNQWKIRSIPGWTGWLSRQVLSRLPYLRRLFFRDYFDFVELEMAYIRDGYEWAFPRLIETLLHHTRLHHALIWSDPCSRLHRQLMQGGRFGILHRLSPPTRAGVYYKPIAGSKAFAGPCYISADGIS